MKKIPKDPNWHYLKWLGIAIVSILLFGIINNIDKFFVRENETYILDKNRLLNPYGYNGLDGRFRFLPNGLVERNYYMLQLQDQLKTLVSNSEEFLNY